MKEKAYNNHEAVDEAWKPKTMKEKAYNNHEAVDEAWKPKTISSHSFYSSTIKPCSNMLSVGQQVNKNITETDSDHLNSTKSKSFYRQLSPSTKSMNVGLSSRMLSLHQSKINVWFQGIVNVGNTCYISTVLQALLSLPLFFDDLIKRSIIPSSKDSATTVYGELRELARRRRTVTNRAQAQVFIGRLDKVSPPAPLNPNGIKAAVGRRIDTFLSGDQQDAHEFLVSCLSIIHDEFSRTSMERGNITLRDKKLRDNSCRSVSNALSLSKIGRGIEKPLSIGIMDETPTTFFFGSLVSSVIKCSRFGCGIELSRKVDQYQNFSLDIPSETLITSEREPAPITLSEMMLNFFSEEPIDYTCHHCGCEKAIMTRMLTKLPRILVLHVKRFINFGKSGGLYKRSERIIPSDILDLSSYVDIETCLADGRSSFDGKTPLSNRRNDINCKRRADDIANHDKEGSIKFAIPPLKVPRFLNNEIRSTYVSDMSKSSRNCSENDSIALLDEEQLIQLAIASSLETAKETELSQRELLQVSLSKSRLMKHQAEKSMNCKENGFNFQNSSSSDDASFRLMSIVNHIGDTIDGGHYTADVLSVDPKLPKNGTYPDIWLNCDDTKTRILGNEMPVHDRMHTAYMLFYVQKRVLV